MSSDFLNTSTVAWAPVRRKSRIGGRIRRVVVTTTALTFMLQNLAWAVCSDGTIFPDTGLGFTPATGANWSPFTFTGTLGSVWVPDISVNEHNNPLEPSTFGGHDWVFDQGPTTCKATDVGGASGPPTAWSIPPVNFLDCMILPIIRNGLVQNFGDIPQYSTALTPTCDPTHLSTDSTPNPANTYLNQLGCAIVRQATGTIIATTPETATTFLFTAGIKSGLFFMPLTSISASILGLPAGKVNASGFTHYSTIPPGQKLDHAAISPDGRWLFGGSSRNNDTVFACRNPLGDPGDPAQALPSIGDFANSVDTSPANPNGVKCMAIGQGGDNRIKGLAVGTDGQLYIAGVGMMSNFVNFPACITAGTTFTIAQAFTANTQNHCGKAVPNAALNTAPDGITALKVETQALVSHGQYLYRAVKGGVVYQAKLSVDQTGATSITQRFFATGFANPTGIGLSEGLASTMIYDDPSGLALAARESITKLPICEDIP